MSTLLSLLNMLQLDSEYLLAPLMWLSVRLEEKKREYFETRNVKKKPMCFVFGPDVKLTSEVATTLSF